MTKLLVFDAGPVISLTTNNLLWLLPKLKQQFGGSFCIPLAVKRELVDRPFVTKKFKFEAIQVEQQIESKTLTVLMDDRIRVDGGRLQDIANSIFVANGQTIAIVQKGEMESIAASLMFGADAFVTDERITRLLLESPESLKQLLEKRLHAKIKINDASLYEFQQKTRHVKIIRSVELVTIAYELGLLDKFVVALPQSRKELLESILWGVKLHGCAVSEQEINEIVKLELRK
ncbi:hypothetical protein HY484_01270 [Candidatus Woesearchaeota archaeon]|nr:hypothetical protein [Candidatus Woesearchaeota archaeon]